MSNRIESDRRRRPSLNTVLAFGRIRSPPRLAALCTRVYSRVPLIIEYHSWYYRVGLAIRHCGFGRFTCPFSTINSHLFDRVKTNESLRPFSTSILTVRVSRPPNELSDRVGWVDGRRQRLVRLSRRYENNRSWRRWKIAGFSTAISTRYACLSRREGRVHAAIGAGPNRFREGKNNGFGRRGFFSFLEIYFLWVSSSTWTDSRPHPKPPTRKWPPRVCSLVGDRHGRPEAAESISPSPVGG